MKDGMLCHELRCRIRSLAYRSGALTPHDESLLYGDIQMALEYVNLVEAVLRQWGGSAQHNQVEREK